MDDYYLKFIDQAEAERELAAAGYVEQTPVLNEAGELLRTETTVQTSSTVHALHVVGTVFKPTGSFVENSEGELIPQVKALQGYHVNLRLMGVDFSENLVAFVITPNTPSTVFG